MNLIAITNPSDESAEAEFITFRDAVITLDSIIPEFGELIEDGAQIVIVTDGESPRVWQYIAERAGDTVWIRTNSNIATYVDVEDVGPCVAEGIVNFAEAVTPVEPLETFTVFGENDDGVNFVAVVSATDDTVRDVGVQAGLVDPGYEYDVTIAAILRGDQSNLESVTV